MKKIAALTFVICLAFGFGLTTGACQHPPPTLTPAAQTAFTADQAVVRVNELMNAAIAANDSGALDTATTRIIVTFAVDADQVLANTPSGYVATVQAAWAAAKPQIHTTNAIVTGAMAAVDAVLGGLQ